MTIYDGEEIDSVTTNAYSVTIKLKNGTVISGMSYCSYDVAFIEWEEQDGHPNS